MADEVRGRPPEQRVVVLRLDHRVDRDDAVAAGAVLDDDRMAPHLRQAVGIEARTDVRARAGPERDDELDRLLRPRLRRRAERNRQRDGGGGNADERLQLRILLSLYSPASIPKAR